MPTPKLKNALNFSGKDNDILSEFLQEYEGLADRNGLTEVQKVEQCPRYVPCHI